MFTAGSGCTNPPPPAALLPKERPDRLHHGRQLILGKLRENRQRHSLLRSPLGLREIPGGVPQAREAFLQVQRDGVIHSVSNPSGCKVIQQLVPARSPDHELVVNMMIRRRIRLRRVTLHRQLDLIEPSLLETFAVIISVPPAQ